MKSVVLGMRELFCLNCKRRTYRSTPPGDDDNCRSCHGRSLYPEKEFVRKLAANAMEERSNSVIICLIKAELAKWN